jgi:hypothetical protein
MAAYETDIDPIDVIDDEHHHEQRQHMALDLGRRAGKHGRVWRTLEDIHGQLPLIVFLRDESMMDAEDCSRLI